MNQNDIFTMIKALTGQANVLTIPRLFIDLTDADFPAALLLGQIIYWTDKTKSPGGWIYKSYHEWQDEIGLTAFQTKRAADMLKKKGLIETKVKRANSSPTVHYRLIPDNLTNSIIKFLDNQETRLSRNLVNVNQETSLTVNQETSLTLTETTQKIQHKLQAEETIPDCLNTPEFVLVWRDWKKYRSDTKHKLTDLTSARQLKKLAGYPVGVAVAMIEQSIEHGWQGLFDVKNYQSNQTGAIVQNTDGSFYG